MIEVIEGLPDHVLGLRATGHVSAADYEKVVIPAVEAHFTTDDRRGRMLYHLPPAFVGFDAHAMWDDARLGLRHVLGWEKIAIVTDVEWIRAMAATFRFLIPAHVRLFRNDEYAAAVAWLAE